MANIGVAHRDSLGAVRAYAATPFDERDPAISPDGRWMSYTSAENGRADVFVSAFPVPKGRYLVSTNGGSDASLGKDSRTIYFQNDQRFIYAATFATGEPPTISVPRTIYTRDPWGQQGVSPDGHILGFVDRVREGEPQAVVVQLHAVVAKPVGR